MEPYDRTPVILDGKRIDAWLNGSGGHRDPSHISRNGRFAKQHIVRCQEWFVADRILAWPFLELGDEHDSTCGGQGYSRWSAPLGLFLPIATGPPAYPDRRRISKPNSPKGPYGRRSHCNGSGGSCGRPRNAVTVIAG